VHAGAVRNEVKVLAKVERIVSVNANHAGCGGEIEQVKREVR
jgi:hypothetical protein